MLRSLAQMQMARGLGVQLAPPALAELGRVGVIINLGSILADIAPFFVVILSTDWKQVDKFFSIKSSVTSAVMNFLVLSHVLFVNKNEDQHRDVVFVSVVGLVTAAVYSLMLLTHRVVMKKSHFGRELMCLILLFFLGGLLVVLGGIFVDYQGTGLIINGLGITVVLVLNALTVIPILTGKGFPDDDTLAYTVSMSMLNTFDSMFFVMYAHFLGLFGSFLSVGSLLNVLSGVVLFLLLTVPALRKGLRKVKNWCQSCAASCGGFFRLIRFIISFGRHGRND
ncbi:uncharacterized protein [Aegilops tauschii subsp. strangulata]|uniref:uncharacterized protein n=1 Tax=Aegilops tauschii subsp. strangulata TaxID=200361 RepID=UPI001E1CAE4F|nr:uncharacterized protein LOC120976893 [Aegilops tauschii subsp. strangulata]